MARTGADTPPPGRLGNLVIIWRFVGRYKGHVAAALLALVVAAGGMLYIPNSFRLIIDKGFAASRGDINPWFEHLLAAVLVMAVATAFRFYFVSWLGERVVADVREAVQRNLVRLAPSYFEENRPSEIASRLTADTTIIEQVVGTTISVALRNVVMGIGGVAYLFALAPKLTAMLLVGIP
ncbi:MAG: ABC transporter, partial [Alphaproteobacteria bacterium]|nr:ABC transporter [Alphaproteobacteria bacterium]